MRGFREQADHGRRGSPQGRNAAGFSLIELLLALALGLVIVAGIVQLFVANSQTYTLMTGQARLQESGRFALEFISRAARSAGYFGCLRQPDVLVRGLRGDWSFVPEFDVRRFVEGSGGAGANAMRWPANGTIFVHTEGNGISPAMVQAGTDAIVFRTLRQPVRPLVATLQPDGNPVISAPGGDPGFGVGDVVMVVDCQQAAVATITAMAVAGDEATLTFAAGASGSLFENLANVTNPVGASVPFTLSFLQRSYGEGAVVGAIESTYFYVAPGLGVNNQNQTPLSLWQKVGTAGPVELVQGVEDLEILYGVDTTLNDGIANANRYFTYAGLLAAGLDPTQVVSIRVSVTVNSVDTVTDDNQVLRRTFSKTLLLRNSMPEA